MISRRRLLGLSLAALAMPRAGLAAASRQAIDGAGQFIEWLAGQAIGILQSTQGSLEQREAAFRELLGQGFDLDFIGRFVLGRNWRRATPDQRADYLALFGEFLLKTYSRRLGGYTGEQFHITGARAAGKKDILVQTRIDRPAGPPIMADWRVRIIDKQYRIIDVSVEGVSMAVTQRSEFNAVIQNSGIEGLMEALRARTTMYQAKAS